MHLVYVDESGDYGINQNNSYFIAQTPSKHFLRTFLVVHDRQWKNINKKINDFKAQYSIPHNIELHATDINAGRGWFNNIGIKSHRRQFLKELCTFIAGLKEVTIASVIFDKSKIAGTIDEKKQILIFQSWEYIIERITKT